MVQKNSNLNHHFFWQKNGSRMLRTNSLQVFFFHGTIIYFHGVLSSKPRFLRTGSGGSSQDRSWKDDEFSSSQHGSFLDFLAKKHGIHGLKRSRSLMTWWIFYDFLTTERARTGKEIRDRNGSDIYPEPASACGVIPGGDLWSRRGCSCLDLHIMKGKGLLLPSASQTWLRPGNALFNLEYLSIDLFIHLSIHPSIYGKAMGVNGRFPPGLHNSKKSGIQILVLSPVCLGKTFTGMMVRKGHSTNIAELFSFFFCVNSCNLPILYIYIYIGMYYNVLYYIILYHWLYYIIDIFYYWYIILLIYYVDYVCRCRCIYTTYHSVSCSRQMTDTLGSSSACLGGRRYSNPQRAVLGKPKYQGDMTHKLTCVCPHTYI